MTQGIAGASAQDPGVQSLSRLADRIAGMAPVLDLGTVAKRIDPPGPRPQKPRPSPTAMAALARTDAMTGRAAAPEMLPQRKRSLARAVIEAFVAACNFIPYALVALCARLVIARAFFLDGQTRVDGPRLRMDIFGFDTSVVLPLQVKAETLAIFSMPHIALPVSPVLAAYLVSGAGFLLPVMLAVGFGTRVAALGLLVLTVVTQLYLAPHALWSAHVYWASLLMVILALGPGRLSLDALIRAFSR